MPAYTLHYFNGRGRAEVCRLLFAAAGVQYNDKRGEFSEWNQYKTKTAYVMLPVLEIDNKTQIPESMAIARFLSREFGFHGKNNMDMLRVDYISDCFYDILDDYMRMFHEKDGKLYAETGQKSKDPEERMIELRQRYMETCRRILPFMEKTLEFFNNGGQFFMGEQIMLCDMMFFAALENPLKDDPTLLNNYPKMKALWERITNHPKLSSYLKKRVQTDY